MRGVFVIFEGIDGSGKSTTVAAIHERLARQGIRSVTLREPTEKTDASREIRRILRTATHIDEKTRRELLDLFLIDRLWDIRNQIVPAINSSNVVLLDRYYISTAAYQAEGISRAQEILRAYFEDSRILQPDMVVYLDLPVADAVSRLAGRKNKDVFENETKLTEISTRYAEAVRLLRERFPKIPVVRKTTALRDGDYDAMTQQIAALQAAEPV